MKNLSQHTIVLMLLLSIVTLFLSQPLVAQAATDIVALKTGEQISVNGMADEGFWSRIPATVVPLSGSNEYGGHVSSVNIKVAHNGTWLFILATWTDATEDRMGQNPITLSQGQYLHNETYYYEDHFISGWSMAEDSPTSAGVNPFAIDTWFIDGRGPEGMIANSWTWGGTDTDSGGPAWPYPDSPPPTYRWGPHEGEPLIYPYSYARDSLMNSTGNWIIGTGLFHGGGVCNVNPAIDLEGFTVRAKGLWESNVWTLEVARPFTTVANNMPYSIQFEQGQTYPVSFAVLDGYQGEVMETNSISEWMNIELSSQYTYLEQDVLDATQAAQDAAQAADETRKVAETSTTLTYVSIAVSAIAIIMSAISLSRKKE